MAGGGDEEQAAVNAGILDEAVTHGSQLLAKEGRVLVLDVLDNGLPARNRKAIDSFRLVLLLRTKENKIAHSLTRKHCHDGLIEWCLPVLVVNLVTVSGGVNNVESQLDTSLDNGYKK